MDALVTHDLCKSYGPHEVLHEVNLRVPTGCLFGFLGPNGAGKTTAIRVVLGLLHYYRPLVSVRTGEWPLGDIAVLVGIAGCCWLAGLWWFSRRDIPAA